MLPRLPDTHAFHPTKDLILRVDYSVILCTFPILVHAIYTTQSCYVYLYDTLYVHGRMVLMSGSKANNMDHILALQ